MLDLVFRQDPQFCVSVKKFHRMSSRSADSIYFHHCRILPSPSLHLLSMCVTLWCVVAAFQWETGDLFLAWSTHPHTSITYLAFSSRRINPILPEKHKPPSSFFHFSLKQLPQAIQPKLIWFKRGWPCCKTSVPERCDQQHQWLDWHLMSRANVNCGMFPYPSTSLFQAQQGSSSSLRSQVGGLTQASSTAQLKTFICGQEFSSSNTEIMCWMKASMKMCFCASFLPHV